MEINYFLSISYSYNRYDIIFNIKS